jgi:hypothetical protein
LRPLFDAAVEEAERAEAVALVLQLPVLELRCGVEVLVQSSGGEAALRVHVHLVHGHQIDHHLLREEVELVARRAAGRLAARLAAGTEVFHREAGIADDPRLVAGAVAVVERVQASVPNLLRVAVQQIVPHRLFFPDREESLKERSSFRPFSLPSPRQQRHRPPKRHHTGS